MEIKATPELKAEIKRLLIKTLVLEDIAEADIADDVLLFDANQGLGIDSVDALEMVAALQKKYGVRIGDQNQGRFIIQSVQTIADFVARELAARQHGADGLSRP